MADRRRVAGMLAGVLWCGVAYGDSVTLTPLKDNSIFSSSDDLSNGQGDLFAGTTGEGVRQRGLLAFDISAEIEAGATITRASLSLNLKRASGDSGAQVMSLHRLLEDWGEGSSLGPGGGGANAMVGDATWQFRFFPDEDRAWESPGGDFQKEASASQMVGDVPGPVSWESDGLAADVQSWLDEPQGNNGWLLAGNESISNTARRFSSNEAESAEDRPTLIIEFEPPADDNNSNGNGSEPTDDQDPNDFIPDAAPGCGFGVLAAIVACLMLAVPAANNRNFPPNAH